MWPGTVLEAETQWWMRSRLPPKRTEKKKVMLWAQVKKKTLDKNPRGQEGTGSRSQREDWILRRKTVLPLLQGRKSRWHDKRDAVNLLGPEKMREFVEKVEFIKLWHGKPGMEMCTKNKGW